jgi:hypothetical protein
MTILQLHESVTRMVDLTGESRGRLDLLSDEQLAALGVLAAPDSVAVVTRHEAGGSVTHVMATRGPWLAEHVIDGEAHHLHVADADNAAILLLDRSGFTEPAVDVTVALCRDLDVTLGAYRRACELAVAGDRRRARAALVGEGASTIDAHALVDALAAGRVDVAGLAVDGRRFVGCDLAVAGDARTGRWLVPSTQHVDALPEAAFRHPSMGNVRVLIERVDTDSLRDELALIFGDV